MAADPALSDALTRRMQKYARESAAFAEFDAVVQSIPALSSLVLDDCLRLAEDRAVFSARLNDEPVVVKHFTGLDGIERAARVHAELTSRHKHMGQGPLRVCAPKLFIPDAPLTLRSFQGGARLDKVLAQADPATRLQKLRQAGQWLDLYTSDRRSAAGFGPWKWIKRLNAPPESPFAPLIGQLKAQLRAQAPDLTGKPVQMARTHGDFAALNLISKGSDLIGIDIENSHVLAVTKDLARFLAQAQSERQPDGNWVPVAERDALLDGFSYLTPFDRGPVMRFFYGVELGKRLLGSGATAAQTANLAAALQAYLSYGAQSQ
ncbi:hypothetical protein [Neptunicoccus cionae]|uniref:Uncharacterized protein n=1 Tax=Neptunicoccus cionae TaxID=2035344 RepID=A0A916VMY6_9RHOB|nr:hypothetical protein [Amylibacter cionae]GGA07347.1 hypothetical protein GCM10011498_04030 [Amylibacter cionae]